MNKILVISALSLIALNSCGSKKADKTALLGHWSLEDIDFPLYENDYKARVQMNDTMKHLDIGKAMYWGTQNVDSIKKLERDLIDKEHEFMIAEFKKYKLNFISDSLVVKTTNMFTDSMYWEITPDQMLVLVPSIESNKRPDTMKITYFNGKEIQFSEPFMKTEVKTTYLKK